MLGTCCSLRGKAAAYELEALGCVELGERMYDDMTCTQAASFAIELRNAADTLDRKYDGAVEKPHGAGYNGILNPTTHETVWSDYSTFEEAVDTIRDAARWYEKIGGMGFGVHAWY